MVIILRGIEILTPYASIHYKSEVDISESVILTSNLNASQCVCSGKHGSQQQTDVCMANLGSSECNGLQKQPHCSDAVHSKNVCKPKTFKIPMNISSFWISNHFFFFIQDSLKLKLTFFMHMHTPFFLDSSVTFRQNSKQNMIHLAPLEGRSVYRALHVVASL